MKGLDRFLNTTFTPFSSCSGASMNDRLCRPSMGRLRVETKKDNFASAMGNKNGKGHKVEGSAVSRGVAKPESKLGTMFKEVLPRDKREWGTVVKPTLMYGGIALAGGPERGSRKVRGRSDRQLRRPRRRRTG